MSEKPLEFGVRFMSAIAEASFLIRRIAGPRQADESVKLTMRRTARRLAGWSANRVKDLWYADPRVKVSGDELLQLRAVARSNEDKARDEYRELNQRIARLEARLLATDADFYGPDIAALRGSIGVAGRKDRAGD